jgi:hypothetical protein
VAVVTQQLIFNLLSAVLAVLILTQVDLELLAAVAVLAVLVALEHLLAVAVVVVMVQLLQLELAVLII